MKRFFKPVEKDGSAKKPALSSLSSPSKDSEKPTENAAAVNDGNNETTKKEPSKFLTWNANSLLLRIKNNWAEFSKFVENLDPDVIAIQEVRMPAAGSKGAPRNPRELKDDTSSSREEKLVMMRALSSAPFKNYNVWWSLSDSKYAGTALFVKKCFNPKVSFSLDQADRRTELELLLTKSKQMERKLTSRILLVFKSSLHYTLWQSIQAYLSELIYTWIILAIGHSSLFIFISINVLLGEGPGRGISCVLGGE